MIAVYLWVGHLCPLAASIFPVRHRLHFPRDNRKNLTQTRVTFRVKNTGLIFLQRNGCGPYTNFMCSTNYQYFSMDFNPAREKYLCIVQPVTENASFLNS